MAAYKKGVMNLNKISKRLLFLVLFCISTDFMVCQDIDSELADGSCQIYNNTECAEFFSGQYVYVFKHKTIHRQEKKLRRWFKKNKKSGQISRECWNHAKALTCGRFYPKCNILRKEPEILPLCKQDCDYVKGICKGEYKRTLRSSYNQEFFPLCDADAILNRCSHLQTYNPSEGPKIFAEPPKHTRKTVGEKVILKCFFGIHNFLWDRHNKGMVREGTWLRNNKRVTARGRIKIETKPRGKARLCMLLKINKATLKDQGHYQCEITFANKTIQSSARLSVKSSGVVPVVIPKKTRQVTKHSVINKHLSSTNGQNIKNGKCVPYSGRVCSAYLDNTNIFELTLQPMKFLNSQLENVLSLLKTSKVVSKKCEAFGQAVLCYHKYNRCNAGTGRYAPSLCKSDCLAFTNGYCKDELNSLKGDKETLAMFIPQCDVLPDDNKLCLPIIPKDEIEEMPKPLKNQIHNLVDENVNCYDEGAKVNYIGKLSMTHDGKFCDKWNQYLGYETIDHEYCRNFGDSRPWCFSNKKKVYCEIKPCQTVSTTPGCFTGRGEEYRGKVAVSMTGQKCVQWNRVTPRFSNVEHSYCRNFLGDMNGPWCYVGHGVREMCNIQRCNGFRSGKGEDDRNSGSLITIVVPSIVGSTVILFLVFLLAFYWKNKKLIHHQKNSQSKDIVDVRDTEKLTEETDVQKTNTLSTNASFDFGKKEIVHKTSPEVTRLPPSPPFEMRHQTKRFKKSVPEVKEACLSNLVKIGDGNIGQLWQGKYQQSRDRFIPVLVRKLKTDTRSFVVSDFRQEMNSLRCLKHPNIEELVCISLMSEVPFMVFDGRHKTDLKEHIFDNSSVTASLLLNYINQITAGLEYLHQQKVLHHDLAARNCFVTPEGVVYISKSGLGMYRYPNDYINLSGMGLSPVRWLSPETLKTGVYRIPTDIYMLGVLIWELFSYGEEPYNELSDNDAIQEILNENKLMRPASCPAQIWNIVEQCWVVPGCQRPSVSWIRRNIRVLNAERMSSVSV